VVSNRQRIVVTTRLTIAIFIEMVIWVVDYRRLLLFMARLTIMWSRY